MEVEDEEGETGVDSGGGAGVRREGELRWS